MSNQYNPSVEVGYLGKIAFYDYVGARILWNLGCILPAIHLLQESLEKYLKVLWIDNKTFDSEQELNKQLIDFKHDIQKIISSLDPNHQKQLGLVTKKSDFRIYNLSSLRYGTNLPLVIYNEKIFREMELCIRKIRKLLGIPAEKNLLREFDYGLYPICKDPKKRDEILKMILSLKNKKSSKKERKAFLMGIRAMVEKLKQTERS